MSHNEVRTTDRRLKRKLWKGYQRSVPSSNRMQMLVTMKNMKIPLKVKLKKCLIDLRRKKLKPWPHRWKNLCMQASASRTFSLQQFQPKEEDTKVSYSDTFTLATIFWPKEVLRTKIRKSVFVALFFTWKRAFYASTVNYLVFHHPYPPL